MKKVYQLDNFRTITERVGQFNAQGKKFLIPEMNKIGSHLLSGVLRSFGVNAEVMETYEGLDLGKKFTSGKECFPCVITLGDILLYMKKERERLGNRFNPENYIYFMPESTGPCRFGMYNKYHRIVLDTFPDLDKVKIGSLTSEDSYSVNGLISKEKIQNFRKAGFLSIIAGDILDRLLWKIRPYEKKEGMADKFINKAMGRMTESFFKHSSEKNLSNIFTDLVEIVKEGKEIINPDIPQKPLIGMMGEIYVRSHLKANQDTIRTLEKYGAEVINASIAEWINYTTYDQARLARVALKLNLRRFRVKEIKESLLKYLKYNLTLFCQYRQQTKAYRMVRNYIDIEEDHKISHLEKTLKKDNIFSFEVGTEACLSIATALKHAHAGYNGVANIFPFTCMPSNITSAIAKPLMARLNIPYIDASYDGSFQPGREAALRTFMYQACQHLKTRGRS